ncbi:MAG: hypothetical protein IJA23_04805, partial [Clostridia bacterium]|nr:hypothetical protein [Clostridia bacterium]
NGSIIETTPTLIGMLNNINHYYNSDRYGNNPYDYISLDFKDTTHYIDGYKDPYLDDIAQTDYVAYVRFDNNDWWFEATDGNKIDNALYYILVQKFGYYFRGWFAGTDCLDKDAVLEYYEYDAEENVATGYYKNEALVNLDYEYYIDSFAHVVKNLRSKYGYTSEGNNETAGDWIENRETGTFQITLYAKWIEKHYKVATFDVNKFYRQAAGVADYQKYGTTTPYLTINKTHNYIYEDYIDAIGNLRSSLMYSGDVDVWIEFDTNNWYLGYETIDASGERHYHIDENDYLKNILIDRYGYTWIGWFTNKQAYNATKVIDGHNYAMFNQSSAYESNILDTAKFTYKLSHSLELNSFNYTNRTITLFANWEANVYDLQIDFHDVNSPDYSKMGSSAAMFVDRTTYTNIQITFDTQYDNILDMMRNGYTFVGWRFGSISDAKSPLLPKGTSFVLSNDYIFALDYSNSNDVFLYTKSSCQKPDQEALGDIEGKNITNTSPVIYTHHVIVYAMWEKITYKVSFKVNKVAGTSTTPY